MCNWFDHPYCCGIIEVLVYLRVLGFFATVCKNCRSLAVNWWLVGVWVYVCVWTVWYSTSSPFLLPLVCSVSQRPCTCSNQVLKQLWGALTKSRSYSGLLVVLVLVRVVFSSLKLLLHILKNIHFIWNILASVIHNVAHIMATRGQYSIVLLNQAHLTNATSSYSDI